MSDSRQRKRGDGGDGPPRSRASGGNQLRGAKYQVLNKNTADFQMTAEQLILDSHELHRRQAAGGALKQPDLILTTREELAAHQMAKRQKLQEIAHRDTSRLGPWMAYAAWEELQGDIPRMRGVYELALQCLGTRADVWSTYAKAEIRSGTALHAQQVLRRATKALPGEHALWLQAILLERCIAPHGAAAAEAVREIFGQWLAFKPGEAVWREWGTFEISVAREEEEEQQPNIERDDDDRQRTMLSYSAAAPRRNRFERARSVLARYVSEHNTADAWLFYASCEREHMILSSSGNNNNSNNKQAVKVLQTALQAIPETEQHREDAARLALAIAHALEADGDDNAARTIYTKLLEEFFDLGLSASNQQQQEDEDADDEDGADSGDATDDDTRKRGGSAAAEDEAKMKRRRRLQQQRRFKDQLRDTICDALVTLEKRCGTAAAAAAVEERKRRWELQQALSRRRNGGSGDSSDFFAARLELLQLERSALHRLHDNNNQGAAAVAASSFSSSKKEQEALTHVARLYERICFPSVEEIVHMNLVREYAAVAEDQAGGNNSKLNESRQLSDFRAGGDTAPILDALSIAWESFSLFCEQELQSPAAALDVFRRAIDLLEGVNSNPDTASSSSSENISSIIGSSSVGTVDLLSHVVEHSALLNLRALDEYKFRLCMQLAAKLADAAATAASASSSVSTSTTTTLFSVLRRWAEIEGRVNGAGGVAHVLRQGLEYRQCKERAAVWHSLADALDGDVLQQIAALEEGLDTLLSFQREKNSAADGNDDDDNNDQQKEKFTVSEEEEEEENKKKKNSNDGDSASTILRWLERQESAALLEAEEAAIDSIFLRIFKLRFTIGGEQQRAQCQTMLEQRMERHVNLYVEASNKHKALSTAADAASASSATANRRQRLTELADGLAKVIRYDFSMLERFFFAVGSRQQTSSFSSSSSCSSPVAYDAVQLSRRMYRCVTTDIRKRCGEQATRSVVESWKRFEDAHGDAESRKAMDKTANAVATRNTRLFQRAHQAEKK